MNATRSIVLHACTCPACGCRHYLPPADTVTFGRVTECGPCLDAGSRAFESQLLGDIRICEAGPGLVRLVAQTLDGHRWSCYAAEQDAATQADARRLWDDFRGVWTPYVF